ncbi:MAG: molybdopterin molybdotransferase MoeA [Spirochaetes bacterium]|nr:molybdopterin molybdotransferase MoeA [Spirochaetota bacterium]
MTDTPIHPDEAVRLVLEAVPRAMTEEVPLADALGRALPEPLPALVDQPPFDKSAMDGFAHGPAATSAEAGPWRVVELLAAGSAPTRTLGPRECSRIMTGAPLPPGASGVQRVEWTRTDSDGTALVLFERSETASNVILRGENQRAGDTLLGPRLLEPQDIGILASSGYARVRVARRPIVGVVSTGDEIVEPGKPLGPASIYDSNGPQLAAQARMAGCEVRSYGIHRDDETALRDVLGRAHDECDVILVSGGVSMGDFDHVPKALAAVGFACVFHGLAMRPGKPTFFGRSGKKTAFGLPGNPVSTFVNFEVLVRVHLFARMGLSYFPRTVRARLAEPLARKGFDRVEFLPARLETAKEGMLVRPLRYHGSSMLAILAEADCILRMEPGAERVGQGEVVDARLLRS